MLKVVLIDDEVIIRDGLRQEINWESLNMEIVGEAENGLDALEVVATTQADLIITDIRMPFMDGLQFIEKIKKKYPEIYIIIITGHDEFQYAQRAIKLGAYDYLLKPIDLEAVILTLKNIQKKHEEQYQQESALLNLQTKLAERQPLLIEHFFKDLIYEKLESFELSEHMKELDLIKFEKSIGLVMLLQLDNYYLLIEKMSDPERRSFEKSLTEIIKKTVLAESYYCYEEKYCEYAIIILEHNSSLCEEKARFLIKTLREVVNQSIQATFTIGIGTTYPLKRLSSSYQEALKAMSNKFILGKNREIFFNRLETKISDEIELKLIDEAELIEMVRLSDLPLIKTKLQTILTNISTLGENSYFWMQIVAGNIFRQALQILREIGATPEQIFDDPLTVFQQIFTRQTIQEMNDELLTALTKIAQFIEFNREKKFGLVLEKAKQYISKNYNLDNLSLEDVASQVNISPCYFSLIFKQELGISFIDFLTNLRINKAKELLTFSNYKTYEISYQVGYNNPTYFSTIFKKHVGFSPTEYRNQTKEVL